jgi:hypothetical protein
MVNILLEGYTDARTDVDRIESGGIRRKPRKKRGLPVILLVLSGRVDMILINLHFGVSIKTENGITTTATSFYLADTHLIKFG